MDFCQDELDMGFRWAFSVLVARRGGRGQEFEQREQSAFSMLRILISNIVTRHLFGYIKRQFAKLTACLDLKSNFAE